MNKIGQRGFFALLSTFVIVGATFVGQSNGVSAQAVTNTPNTFPIGAFIALLWAFFQVIERRVSDPTDPFHSGDYKMLLLMRETYIFLVGLLALGGQLWGIRLLDDPDLQAQLITLGMAVGAIATKSWANRPSGSGTVIPPNADTQTLTRIVRE